MPESLGLTTQDAWGMKRLFSHGLRRWLSGAARPRETWFEFQKITTSFDDVLVGNLSKDFQGLMEYGHSICTFTSLYQDPSLQRFWQILGAKWGGQNNANALADDEDEDDVGNGDQAIADEAPSVPEQIYTLALEEAPLDDSQAEHFEADVYNALEGPLPDDTPPEPEVETPQPSAESTPCGPEAEIPPPSVESTPSGPAVEAPPPSAESATLPSSSSSSNGDPSPSSLSISHAEYRRDTAAQKIMAIRWGVVKNQNT